MSDFVRGAFVLVTLILILNVIAAVLVPIFPWAGLSVAVVAAAIAIFLFIQVTTSE